MEKTKGAKAKKEVQKKSKVVKPEPTEEELVKKYANRVIKNQIYHGRVDESKFKGMEHHTVSKNLWMDTNFFFSVVFQNEEQKNEFIWQIVERHRINIDGIPKSRVQIINGLELAKALGIELKPAKTREYPTGNIDLMPFVLDNESL